MCRMPLIAAAILVFANAGAAQEKVARAPGPPPTITLARAVKNDGKIEVLLTRIVQVPVQRTEVVEENGKKVERVVTLHVAQIQEIVKVADGKQLIVTRKDGKNVDAADLPRLLEKQTAVVLFDYGFADPQYLQIVRDDALVITLQPVLLVPPPAPKDLPAPKEK